MSIDIEKQRPILANNMGGLSGPAVKPVAVRMVYQVAQKVKIPVLGLRRNCNRTGCNRIYVSSEQQQFQLEQETL